MTILNWSFPRKDLSRSAQAYQLALALREEVDDLQKAGCRVIQVDLFLAWPALFNPYHVACCCIGRLIT